ncbi:MAG TPA: DUF2911 domain-containing protein [Thermoanaerobaculia bacterium]|nr:DUF2911 domain-containing protein [Thermoanaerobaculia bacterium]
MKKSKLAVTLMLVALVAVPVALAQDKKPLSPPATAETSIGAAKLRVDYSAPSMRGRTIMGELVPFDKVWRTGANAATTFTTEANLKLGDLVVPKGTYTLFTVPGKESWKLVVNKQNGQWGTRYDEAQDLGRVPMSVRKLGEPVETFLIVIEPKGQNAGVLKLTWETTEVSVPISVQP